MLIQQCYKRLQQTVQIVTEIDWENLTYFLDKYDWLDNV